MLRVSDVNGDLAGTEVLQGRSGVVGILNPLNSLFLTGRPRGGGDGGGGLHLFGVNDWLTPRKRKEKTHEDGGKSRGQDGGQSQEESGDTHRRGK